MDHFSNCHITIGFNIYTLVLLGKYMTQVFLILLTIAVIFVQIHLSSKSLFIITICIKILLILKVSNGVYSVSGKENGNQRNRDFHLGVTVILDFILGATSL